MSGRALALAALVALLSGCAVAQPGPSDPPTTASASPSSAPSAPLPTERSGGISDVEPGRPVDAAAVLDAMRDSRRPGGVPDELETDAIAAELAGLIWTIDGEPWSTITAGGSCGPQTCTLEIAGAHPDSQGDDLWVFEVEPSSGAVKVVSTDLRSVSPDLIDRLDPMTRSIFPGMQGLILTNVRWLPPPDDSQFVASYRSGGEERSGCGADITVDAVARRVVSDISVDC